jgi:hypothetical protein
MAEPTPANNSVPSRFATDRRVPEDLQRRYINVKSDLQPFMGQVQSLSAEDPLIPYPPSTTPWPISSTSVSAHDDEKSRYPVAMDFACMSASIVPVLC